MVIIKKKKVWKNGKIKLILKKLLDVEVVQGRGVRWE